MPIVAVVPALVVAELLLLTSLMLVYFTMRLYRCCHRKLPRESDLAGARLPLRRAIPRVSLSDTYLSL